jgi:membrane fusion protein, multidrug efflux system
VLKTVTIARDLGREVEIASGLSADDRVITSPPDGIASGDKVRVTGSLATAAPAPAKQPNLGPKRPRLVVAAAALAAGLA